MEEILYKYFGCKKAYNKNGTLTNFGENAYGKLIHLLSDIDELVDTNFISKLDELDELAPSSDKNRGHILDKYGNRID